MFDGLLNEWVYVDSLDGFPFESPQNRASNTKMNKTEVGAVGGKTPSAFFQTPLNLKKALKEIQGSTPLVSWFLDDGKTEIQIAVADFNKAKFDIALIPVNVKLKGIDVYGEGSDMKHYYGSLLKEVSSSYQPGHIYSGNVFMSKQAVLGVCIAKTTRIDEKQASSVASAVMNDKKFSSKNQIIGIPLEFIGSYDPLVLLEKFVQKRTLSSYEQLTIVLCCKWYKPEVSPFILRVEEFMRKQESPRRILRSQNSKDVFKKLSIDTTIHQKGILELECECVVAAISPNFKLDQGKRTKFISDAAGDQLQETINSLVYKNVPSDAILHCPSYKLATKGIKLILFRCLPNIHKFGDINELIKILSDFVKECILIADDQGYSSIAFPALGSGYQNYPSDVIATSLHSGIDKYAESGIKGHVKRVCISYFARDELYEKLESGITRRSSRLYTQQHTGYSSVDDNSSANDKASKKHQEWNPNKSAWQMKSDVKDDPITNDTPGADYKQPTHSSAFQKKGDQGTPDLQEWQKGADGTDDSSNKVQSSSNNNTIHTDDGEEMDSMSNSSDNKTSETSDDTELLLDDVTAEVNPGLTDYLLGSGTYEKFRDHVRQKFGIRVDIDKHVILFGGPFDKIVEAEELLEKMVENGSNFNDVLKPENNPTSSGPLHGSENLSSRNGEASYNETTDYVPFDDSLVTPKGATVPVNNFHLQNKTNVHVFNTDNMFSFSTDVKVLTTDKDQTHKTENHFMRQAKDKIPKLKGIVVEESFEIIPLVKLCTCKFIVIAVVPNDSKDITKREKDKSKFKSSVSELTNGILQKADELYGVQSITFPLLVNTEKGAHISTCCSVMSGEIVAFLERSTNIKHVNVILESGRILREFSKCVEQKLPKTGTLSTQF